GIQPQWLNGIRLVQTTTFDFMVNPGDGSKLTPEQIQEQLKKGPAQGQPGAGGGGGGQVDKAKAEAAQNAQQDAQAENQKLQARYNEAVKHFNQGVQLKNATPADLQAALSEFEIAAQVDPGKHAAYLELSHKANALVAQTQNQIGAELYNHGKKEEAKPHFEASSAAIKKALEIAADDKSPTINAQLITYYSVQASNAKILIDQYGQANIVEDEIKNLDKAEAIDSPNKAKWEVLKGDLYRISSKYDEAVAAYKSAMAVDPNNADALYNMAMALLTPGDKSKYQAAIDSFKEFLKKFPK